MNQTNRIEKKVSYYVQSKKLLSGDKNNSGLGSKRLTSLENCLLNEFNKYELKNHVHAENILCKVNLKSSGRHSFNILNLKSSNRHFVLDSIFDCLPNLINQPVKLSKIEFINDIWEKNRHILLLDFSTLKNFKFEISVEFIIISKEMLLKSNLSTNSSVSDLSKEFNLNDNFFYV